MANSLSAEVWLDQRRWDALEEALKAQGSDIEQHLQRSTRSIPSFMFGSMAMTVSSQRVMAKNFWM